MSFLDVQEKHQITEEELLGDLFDWDEPTAEIIKCSCTITRLMQAGCECGALKKERENAIRD